MIVHFLINLHSLGFILTQQMVLIQISFTIYALDDPAVLVIKNLLLSIAVLEHFFEVRKVFFQCLALGLLLANQSQQFIFLQENVLFQLGENPVENRAFFAVLVNLLAHVPIFGFGLVQKAFFLLNHFFYVNKTLFEHAGVFADVLPQLSPLLNLRLEVLDLLFIKLFLL